jgi:ParB family chromosome partitioning protein
VAEYREVPLTLIDPPKDAWRKQISPEEVQLLAESIRSLGLLQPLGVVAESGRYRVVYGHRRLLACQWCRLDPVPCFLGKAGDEAEGLATGAENIARRDLSPVEEAQAIRGLIDGHGLSVDAAAKALGRSASWIRLRLDLLRWPVEFIASLGSGELSVSVARELVSIEDSAVREHYRKCAQESGCTAWQAKLWRREWEVSSLPHREGEELPPVPPLVGKCPVPMFPCALCEVAHDITALGFLRVCPSCVGELDRAKRDTSGGRAA